MSRNIMIILIILSIAGICRSKENNDEVVVGWRYDGTGEFPDARCVDTFSTEENVIWKTPTENWSNASPVIVGDRIFITEEPKGKWVKPNGTLVCLSAKDGTVLWRRSDHTLEDIFTGEKLEEYTSIVRKMDEAKKNMKTLYWRLGKLSRDLRKDRNNKELQQQIKDAKKAAAEAGENFAKNYGRYNISAATYPAGYTSPTPVSDGRNVYAYFGNDVIVSYDLDGNRRWAVRAGDGSEIPSHACRSSSPRILDNKLIVRVDATHVYAFDLDTGKQLWACPVETDTWITPCTAVVDGLPVIICGRGEIIRATDGKLLLRIEDFHNKKNSMVFKDGILYVAALYWKQFARAYKLERKGDTVTCTLLWQSKRLKSIQPHHCSPLIHDGLMYRCSTKGELSVLESDTGKILYEQKLKFKASNLYTSPTLIGDKVFLGGEKGIVYLFKTGRTYEEVARIEFEPMRSCPVAIGDRLYIRALQHMYCIGKK